MKFLSEKASSVGGVGGTNYSRCNSELPVAPCHGPEDQRLLNETELERQGVRQAKITMTFAMFEKTDAPPKTVNLQAQQITSDFGDSPTAGHLQKNARKREKREWWK